MGSQQADQTISRDAEMGMMPEQLSYSTEPEAAWAERLERMARKRRADESMADGSHVEAEPQRVSVPAPD